MCVLGVFVSLLCQSVWVILNILICVQRSVRTLSTSRSLASCCVFGSTVLLYMQQCVWGKSLEHFWVRTPIVLRNFFRVAFCTTTSEAKSRDLLSCLWVRTPIILRFSLVTFLEIRIKSSHLLFFSRVFLCGPIWGVVHHQIVLLFLSVFASCHAAAGYGFVMRLLFSVRALKHLTLFSFPCWI